MFKYPQFRSSARNCSAYRRPEMQLQLRPKLPSASATCPVSITTWASPPFHFTVGSLSVLTRWVPTVVGKFDVAKHVLDTRWFLLYIAVYIFAMWDCYSLTIDLNKFALLAHREDSSILPFNISALEVYYLDNRNSWIGVIWACFNPGLGSLYIGRLPTDFYALIWFVATVYYAHLLPAIQSTFIGDFQLAKKVLDPEWLLFLPSIMGFATYDTYIKKDSQGFSAGGPVRAETARWLHHELFSPQSWFLAATFVISASAVLSHENCRRSGILLVNSHNQVVENTDISRKRRVNWVSN